METKNAKITGTTLGREDHGIMTAYINLDYGGSSCQSAGGYGFDEYNKKKDCREGTAFGMEFIMRVLEVVGVDRWEDLKGKHIRVKADHCGVEAIGHITDNRWLNFKELAKKHYPDSK